MASILISGKPRGGKSMYGMRRAVIGELVAKDVNGDWRHRKVFTNIPIKWEGLHAYLEKHHLDWYQEHELSEWLFNWSPVEDKSLEWEFVPEFWRYRDGKEPTHESISKADYKDGKRPDWDKNTQGVVYVLDEVHKFLNARRWQNTGDVILDYMSQHAHFGDDVYSLTQAVKNVDTQFRSVTQEFCMCRNLNKERFGKFKKGSGLRVYFYSDERGLLGTTVEPDYKEKFEIDLEIGDTYYTSINAGAADTVEKEKGWPAWMMWVILALIIAVVWILIIFGPRTAMNWLLGGGKEPAQEVAEVPTVSPAPVVVAETQEEKEGETIARGMSDEDLAKLIVSEVQAGVEKERKSRAMEIEALKAEKIKLEEKAKRDVVFMSLVQVQNLPAADLVDGLSIPQGTGSASQLSVSATPDGSSIVLRSANVDDLRRVEALIQLIDKLSRPVRIRLAVATVDLGESHSSGVDWAYEVISGEADSLHLESVKLSSGRLSFVGGNNEFGATISFLEGGDRFQVISRPDLVVTPGRKVRLAAGREIPIQETVRDQVATTTSTTFREVELSVEATVYRLQGDRYALQLSQQNQDVIGALQEGVAPAISTQDFESRLDLKLGEIVVLGGLSVTSESEVETGVPLLRKVPVLRRVFGDRSTEKRRREVVIVVSVEEITEETNIQLKAERFDFNGSR
jgi:Flp pilus assembly secretin CpaC